MQAVRQGLSNFLQPRTLLTVKQIQVQIYFMTINHIFEYSAHDVNVYNNILFYWNPRAFYRLTFQRQNTLGFKLILFIGLLVFEIKPIQVN